MGDAIVKINLLPLLVELSADENILVRSVAIESMVAIIPYLSAGSITVIKVTFDCLCFMMFQTQPRAL